MDFKDWIKAVTEGKVLYRIKPAIVSGLEYRRTVNYYVVQWVWWFPLRWKRVFGRKKGWWYDEGWATMEQCKEYVEQGTIMYEREKID